MCLKAPGNIIISGCGNGLINIFDLETGECIQTINEHTDLVRNILIVSDNRFVLNYLTWIILNVLEHYFFEIKYKN